MWPDAQAETKAWTRWWWLGSAVDKNSISQLLETYHAAGLGGVEITPIYGVVGEDANDLEYLSPEWLDMVRHTVIEAERLGMKVDLPPGSGWKMGGDFLDDSLAAAKMTFDGDAIEIRPSGEKIKRPGPGGGGLAFNPYQRESLDAVAEHFTPALKDLGLRAQFHDSWEYTANARIDLLEVFEERYGYDLREQVADGAPSERARYDLQLLLSDLAHDEFIAPWTEWCHSLGQLSRNQAHGSPGNILDLYAACDIPETEVFRRITPDTPLMSKFASSAAHVAGRRLTSSETGTWIGEHFTVSLGTMKALCDNLFVSGINHHVYHGTAYSPERAAWPGWLFYASSQLNPQNTIWRDFDALNDYVMRCQSVLQDGSPDNDLLVYFPIHDIFQDPDHSIAGHLHIEGDWLFKLPAMDTLRDLWTGGYAFDYVSDKQIAELTTAGEELVSPGGTYRALLVPPCEFMPADTLERLMDLSNDGVAVIFAQRSPSDVPGLAGLDENRKRFAKLIANATVADDYAIALSSADVVRETLAQFDGLRFIRREHDHGHYYFLLNESDTAVDAFIELGRPSNEIVILDPMTGAVGDAELSGGKVRIQLEHGASLVLKTGVRHGESWPYREFNGGAIALKGPWRVEFIEGGPELPEPYDTDAPASWADRGEAYESFAGTAVYSTTFDMPSSDTSFLLDLGAVHSSARVRLNGTDVATLIGPAFKVELSDLKPTGNQLEVEVTSLVANRIRDLDRRGVEWKIFHDINFVNVGYQPFDASDWPVAPAGLAGPVTLQPLD